MEHDTSTEENEDTCSCCGKPMAACETAVEFPTDFRLWIVEPADSGRTPTGQETIHAATNNAFVARTVVDQMRNRGKRARRWNNRSRAVKFPTDFRYWIIKPIDPGAAATGEERIHGATNDQVVARTLLNVLVATGKDASGWDNQRRVWFVTPEIMRAMRGFDRGGAVH